QSSPTRRSSVLASRPPLCPARVAPSRPLEPRQPRLVARTPRIPRLSRRAQRLLVCAGPWLLSGRAALLRLSLAHGRIPAASVSQLLCQRPLFLWPASCAARLPLRPRRQ